MYTSEALIDLHERSHRSLTKLIAGCGRLDPEALERELPGFAYPSVRQQLDHVILAERYWVGVLEGRMDVDGDEVEGRTVEALEALRRQVFDVTASYLAGASAEELNTARPMLTWGDRRQVLMPARIVLRTQTHLYQHQGQVVAMCKLMGVRLRRLDFPID